MILQHRLFSIIFLISIFSCSHSLFAFLGALEKLAEAREAFRTHSAKDLGDLNQSDSKSQTVLTTALMAKESHEFITFLLKKGANPMHIVHYEGPEITFCAMRREIHYLELFYNLRVRFPANDDSLHRMIDHTTQITENYFGKADPDEMTVMNSYTNILALLIKMGSPLEQLNFADQTALARAYMRGQIPYVQTFLENGADPFAPLIDSSSKERITYSQVPPETKAECLKLITAAKKKTLGTFNKNRELYFSTLPLDVMREASNYIQ